MLCIFVRTEANEILVSHFTLGAQGTVWVMDVVGRVWFRTGVTQDKPRGNKGWWQVRRRKEYTDDVVMRNFICTLNLWLILGLRLANERRCCFVARSFIGWAQT